MEDRENSWCQRFHDWLRSLTNSRKYSYGVSATKHDSATAALRIRPRTITTTIRHECFKQFKTSVALPWSFPNYHDSSRFTTIHHDSPRFYYKSPRYTTILQIVANRSDAVAKNRECVNRPTTTHKTGAVMSFQMISPINKVEIYLSLIFVQLQKTQLGHIFTNYTF